MIEEAGLCPPLLAACEVLPEDPEQVGGHQLIMQVGKYFTLAEFTTSQTATRKGIRNVPTEKQIAAIKALCANVLDPLRETLGRPIIVTSGYRSPALNRAIGGSATSQHCKGEAADIIVPGLSVDGVVAAIRASGLPFDQLIREFSAWTHISFSITRERRQALKAVRVRGRVKYLPI